MRLASTTGEKQGDENECETMKWFEFFHDATLSNGHATSFRRATSHLRRGIPSRKRDGSVPFSGKHNAATALVFLEGHRINPSEPTSCHPLTVALERQSLYLPRTRQAEATSCLPDYRGTGSSCRPRNGRRARTRLWYVSHTGLVGRVTAPTAKATRNARDSPSVGPIAIYISGVLSGVLSSTAAQDEHRANQDALKETCFHLMSIPCLIAGQMLAFLLITYQ